MHFTATISGTEPLDFVWDFDGPGTGSGLDTLTPVYTYTVGGDFLVSLVITGPCGSETVTGTVTANVLRFYVYLPLVQK
jgi:PKD repeat protein